MALNWDWNDKMGECTYFNGTKDTLYQGNAHMIAVGFPSENTYQVSWFSIDRDHFKNMLGLNKGHESILDEHRNLFNIDTLRLNTAYSNVRRIVYDLARARVNINIELYYEP